jgi:hypothetical protein
MKRPGGDLPEDSTAAMAVGEAQRRQAIYAASRRDWAERVGRPYEDAPDRRPPPGELDGTDEE